MTTPLLEAITEIPSAKILREEHRIVMKDVVLLSEFSKNKDGKTKLTRRYTKEEQHKAAPLFENKQVNANHPKKLPDGRADDSSRDVWYTLGSITNVRVKTFKEGAKSITKTFGDLVLSRTPVTEHIANLADINPSVIGMSLTGDCANVKEQDNFACIEGLQPLTVDVVHRPATTQGLYESLQELYVGQGEHDKLKDVTAAAAATKAAAALNAASLAIKAAGAEKSVIAYLAAKLAVERARETCSSAAITALRDGDFESYMRHSLLVDKISSAGYLLESFARRVGELTQEAHDAAAELVEAGYAPDEEEEDLDEEDDDLDEEDDDDLEDDEEEDDLDDEEDEDDEDLEDEEEDLGDEDEDDLDDEEDEEDEDEDDEDDAGNDESSARRLTMKADACTEKANSAGTEQANLEAAFEHANAAQVLGKAGKFGIAIRHLDKADEHRERAAQLAQEAARDRMRTPMPGTDQSVKPVTASVELSTKLFEAVDLIRLRETVQQAVEVAHYQLKRLEDHRGVMAKLLSAPK